MLADVTWLQSMIAASTMLNFFLAGLVPVAYWAGRRLSRPAQAKPPGTIRASHIPSRTRTPIQSADNVVRQQPQWYPGSAA